MLSKSLLLCTTNLILIDVYSLVSADAFFINAGEVFCIFHGIQRNCKASINMSRTLEFGTEVHCVNTD